MKSMDFKILDVTITTRSRLQTIGKLIPPRKWTSPKRLRKFETTFPVLSGFGRPFLTIEIASHHQSHRNQSMEILAVAGITRSRLQTIGQLVPARKWTFPERWRKFETKFHVLSGFGRSFLTIEIASHHQSRRIKLLIAQKALTRPLPVPGW